MDSIFENGTVTVVKLDITGREVWRYSTRVLEVTPIRLRVEGFFNKDNVPLEELILKRGDRFIELYYPGRWFNVLEMYDRDSRDLKGWYCNITRPAQFDHSQVAYTDLGLDLLVYPDGRQVVLDEDEFLEMALTAEERKMAVAALEELQEIFHSLPPEI